MDLFEKCYKPSLADEVREKNIYPYLQKLRILHLKLRKHRIHGMMIKLSKKST